MDQGVRSNPVYLLEKKNSKEKNRHGKGIETEVFSFIQFMPNTVQIHAVITPATHTQHTQHGHGPSPC